LDFISRIIEMFYINFPKVICTNYNKNNQTAQLRDNHIILEQLMRSSIVSYFCTEDGQKVGRNVYRINFT